VYVSERVSILLAFHRVYSRIGFYSPKCSLGRPRRFSRLWCHNI
jgi:hypothetical protein